MGQDATHQAVAASHVNQMLPDGVAYLLVKIRARNLSRHPLVIGADDFFITGRSGLVHRFTSALAPNPRLEDSVPAGHAKEGWIVLHAPTEERNLLLVFDSLTMPGPWTECVFALEKDGVGIPDLAKPVASPNSAGKDVTHPARLRACVTTADWQVALLEVVHGMAVYDLFPRADRRTTRLGDAVPRSIPRWLALRVKVTNVRPGGRASFLPPTAFALTDDRGIPVLDALAITPPRPEASAIYYPGASREGWVAFALPFGYQANTVRFLPYRTDPDPRFLTWAGTGFPSLHAFHKSFRSKAEQLSARWRSWQKTPQIGRRAGQRQPSHLAPPVIL